MKRVGVRELKQHTSEIIRQAAQDGEMIEVTVRGKRVARMPRQLLRSPEFRVFPLSERLIGLATQLPADLRLRGADAIFVATARDLGLPLVTLDREILTGAAGTIAVFTPPP